MLFSFEPMTRYLHSVQQQWNVHLADPKAIRTFGRTSAYFRALQISQKYHAYVIASSMRVMVAAA
jgi:hypothetical protein